MATKTDKRPRVLVVGASFGGLAAAEALPASVSVRVVDERPLFQWLPNIHELVSGLKAAGSLTLDRRRIVERAGHRFVRAGIAEIHAEEGRAVTDRGRVLRFDACIVAVGGVLDTFGIPGAKRYALPFKSVAQCEAIGVRLEELFRGRSPVRVTVVGGGLEGVEALGEILRRYRDDPRLQATIVEKARRLMPEAPRELDRTVRRHCKRFGVDVRTGTSVESVAARSVALDDGTRLGSDVTLWTVGSRPAPLLAAAGLAPDALTWAPVEETLQSTAYPNVFVVGDAAGPPEPVAKQAYHALDMGALAAENAVRLLEGRRLRRFRPLPKPSLVAFGDLDTFLVAGDRVVAAPALAAAKEAVFQITMARLDPPTDLRALYNLRRRALGALARAATYNGVTDLMRFLRVRLA